MLGLTPSVSPLGATDTSDLANDFFFCSTTRSSGSGSLTSVLTSEFANLRLIGNVSDTALLARCSLKIVFTSVWSLNIDSDEFDLEFSMFSNFYF